MKKIPTLFVRDENDRRYVTREINPGCEWVIAGEGVATRKYDGTCVMWDGSEWWARREVKAGKTPPEGFRPEQSDETTGKTVGWEPVAQSPFSRFLTEALDGWHGAEQAGTFELCGPKINGNPEGYSRHFLQRHDLADQYDVPRTFDGIADWLRERPTMEGLVFHHSDGRMVKIKRRDFPRSPSAHSDQGGAS